MPASRPSARTTSRRCAASAARWRPASRKPASRISGKLARIPVNELAAILAGLPGRFDVEMGPYMIN